MESKKRNVKGQGSFTMNADGTVTHRKSVGIKADGKRKVLTVTAKSKALCIKLMKEKESIWSETKAKYQISNTDTVVDLCSRHLEYQVNKGELKPKSIDRRESTIDNQIAPYFIGHMQIQAVTSEDIDQLISELIQKGLASSSVEKALVVINAAYNWAISKDEINFNPVSAVYKSIVKRLKKIRVKEEDEADVIVLSDEEQEAFLKETLAINPYTGDYQYKGGLYGRLLFHTGMRVGEMISLRWEDYDKKLGLLTINKNASLAKNRNHKPGETKYKLIEGSTKNQKSRIIQLSEDAVNDLNLIWKKQKGGKSDLICRTKYGNPYTANMVTHCINTIYKHLPFGDEIGGLHIFRRTFATNMYDKGASVKEIAAYIGDLESTTMQYYIAARKKIKVGTDTKQIVPIPTNKNVPAANKDIN